MSISSQVDKVVVNGDGSATVFSFSPMIITVATDLLVVKTDVNGIETTLTLGTGASNYSVSVLEYPGTGSIAYPATGGTPLALGEHVTMVPNLPITQPVNLENQGGYFPDVQEDALDRLTIIAQQLQSQLDRAVKVTVGSDTDPADLIETLTESAAQVEADKEFVEDALTSLNLIQATETQIGIAKVATSTQVSAGVDDTVMVTPKKLSSFAKGTECFIMCITGEATAVAAGTNKFQFRMPYGLTVTSVRASLNTAQTSGSIMTVDINKNGTTILSTKLTIDNTELTSVTAATAPVISVPTLASDDLIAIDVDQVGDGTGIGLKVTLIGHQ